MEPIRIQKVIDHIEEHLTEELSYGSLAALAAVSEADLQRSFKMITGLTISEYIRNRRLTQAALDLKQGEQKVLDIALNYGYQTAESFGKAFKQYHGCTPMEAKSGEHSISFFNPMVVKLAKRGGNTIPYEATENSKNSSVIEYYNASNEHIRLTKNNHSRIEYLVTMRYLEKFIPENSRILDCCAGTGIYSFELAKSHRVTASDLSWKNTQMILEQQEKNPALENIIQLDVCNMEVFKDNSFDVVLCMGALYHLNEKERRIKAVQECRRVCRKGGLLVFAYLNKWGSFYNGLINHLKPLPLLYQEFESGNHEDIFFRTTPEEVERLCAEQNLACICNVGVDHLAYLAPERVDAMAQEEFATFLGYQLKAAEEPGLKGTSLHGLWIGRKG